MNSIVRLAAAALFVVAAHAQVGALSATSDGTVVYFAVTKSEIRQRASDQSFLPKMYAIRDGQLTLVDDTPPTRGLPKQYTRASVSADGSIVAINHGVLCFYRYVCDGIIRATTVITTPSRTFTFEGRSHVTANGRFAVVYGQVKRLDLVTGDLVAVGDPVASYGRFVSEDGTVLARTPLGCQLVGPSSSAAFDCPQSSRHVVLSGDASLIVYDVARPIVYDEAGAHTPYEIHVRNVQSRSVRSFGPGLDPTIAHDSRTLSYLRAVTGFTQLDSRFQVWIADAVTGTTRQLSNEPEGIIDQTITGDGRTVIAASVSGRLLSINTNTGAIHTLLAVPATGPLFAGPAVPGSYNEVPGNLVEGAPEVLFVPAQGRGSTADTLSAVSLGPVPRGFAIQIPWEAGSNGLNSVVVRGNERLWEWRATGVQWFFGTVLPLDSSSSERCCSREAVRTAYAMHEDWSMPVRPETPARPGEVVHFFGTGFGPVEGAVPTGKPTPLDRYYPLRSDTCKWSTEVPYNQAAAVDVLFAGLAPGMTGMYQFDIRVPVDWTGSVFQPYCHTYVGYAYIPPIAVKQ